MTDPVELLRDRLGAEVIAPPAPHRLALRPLRRCRRCEWAGCTNPARVHATYGDRRSAVCAEHARQLLAASPEAASAAVARAGRPDYRHWIAHAAGAGGCTRPVRLRGGAHVADPATGDLQPLFDTGELVYKACGDRRASVCPTCAERYRADTYQLLRAGLGGGKGVPATVTTHPAVFLTVTAPSAPSTRDGPARAARR